MRRKKLKEMIIHIMDKRFEDLQGNALWVLAHQNEDQVKNMRPRVDSIESAINTVWNLPMFKEYRGKQ